MGITSESSTEPGILELRGSGILALEPRDQRFGLRGVPLVQAINLRQAYADEDLAVPLQAAPREQALQHRRLLREPGVARRRGLPAAERVPQKAAQRSDDEVKEAAQKPPRAPESGEQGHSLPGHRAGGEEAHGDGQRGADHRHAEDPSDHGSRARRLVLVHGGNVECRRGGSKLTAATAAAKTYHLSSSVEVARAPNPVAPRVPGIDRRRYRRRRRPGDPAPDATAAPAPTPQPLGGEARGRLQRERPPRGAEGV